MRLFDPTAAVCLLAGWAGAAAALDRGDAMRSIPVSRDNVSDLKAAQNADNVSNSSEHIAWHS